MYSLVVYQPYQVTNLELMVHPVVGPLATPTYAINLKMPVGGTTI